MLVNPFILQLLAMRQRNLSPWDSTASDAPEYGMRPWEAPSSPDPAQPVMEMPEFDEEGARQRARRAGLGALGVALLAGAGKGDYAGSLAQGLAAMAAERDRRYQEERGQYRQDQQDRLAREAYERQNRLTQAQIDNYDADNRRAEEVSRAQAAAREAEVATQRDIVNALPPGANRDRLAQLVGSPPDDFRRYYWEITAPPKPKDPERMRIGNDVLEFPQEGQPRVVYHGQPEPSSRMSTEDAAARAAAIADAVETVRERHGKGVPSQEQLHDDIQSAFDHKYNEWLKQRMEGVGNPVSPARQAELAQKGFKGVFFKKSPTEMRIKTPSGAVMTEDEYMRRKFWAEAEREVRMRQREAGRQRSDMIIDVDRYGNDIP